MPLDPDLHQRQVMQRWQMARHGVSRGIAAGLWFLWLVALVLSACGPTQADSKTPVTPDPQRPTFIFFFTDP